MSDTNEPRWTLRRLPLSARLVLACFLTSVGVGYVSAVVQLHFQHAEPGLLLPSVKNCIKIFHGEDTEPMSAFERILTADESHSFTGTGQMVSAFTDKSGGWNGAIKKHARKMMGRRGGEPDGEMLAKAAVELRAERLGERDAFLDWVKKSADRETFALDNWCLPESMKGKPITAEYVVETEGKDAPLAVKVNSLFVDRCVRCHSKDVNGKASKFPFDTFKEMEPYLKAERAQPMSLVKLAQTTHTHLLSFSMLWGITGLLLALTGLPGFIRLPLAPLPLVAQVVDIGFWWLARLPGEVGVRFAEGIPITGTIVGVAVLLHIVLVLFCLFSRWGWAVLVLLFALAIGGAHVVKTNVVDPYIAEEMAGKADR